MKNSLPKVIAALLFMSAAKFPAPVTAQPQVAVQPPAGLEIQIAASQKQNRPFPTFGSDRSYLSLIFRNTSTKPIQTFEEWSSWGFDNVHLEITAINGETLPQPLIIKKVGRQAWLENHPSIESLAPNQSMVREIRLHIPAAIRHPDTPPTANEISEDDENLASMNKNEYWFFPFATHLNTKTITMKAVYEAPDTMPIGRKGNPRPDVWSRRIESPLLTYEISRYTFGY